MATSALSPQGSRAEVTAAQAHDAEEEDEGEEYVPLKTRRERHQEQMRKKLKTITAVAGRPETLADDQAAAKEEEQDPDPEVVRLPKISPKVLHVKKTLLATSHKLRAEAELHKKDEEEELREEEEKLLEQVSKSINAPLQSVKERAKGIVYTGRMQTSWELPEKYQRMTDDEATAVRDKFFIDVNGVEVPPPAKSFRDMRFPAPILKALADKQIGHPTQIQMQGLPAVLQGRDLIGIAFTGSGKTLVFVLPMVMGSLEAELRDPFLAGEGPWGLVVCPSRELATQTTETVAYFCKHLREGTYPDLKSLCLIGGTDVQQQSVALRSGIHMVVATPGRLNDMLNKKRMCLSQCKYLCFDEADRMVDLGFEEEVRTTFDHFTHQRQTLLFSATMPRKIQEFAKTALVDPIIVNVGRAGAANLDVVQEVEYVKQEAKLPYVLQCLQKTPPPVLIFCENKKDVDDVHEYLLLKGVDASAIHGGLSQEDRHLAIREYR
eukprot:GHVT01028283.1.p1 GENE.GHVT01028283.1~~GHVT01028283.1.p1  ORF type:complete len:493 (-),score=124.45 GHVT01028283.1:747-2225(-)